MHAGDGQTQTWVGDAGSMAQAERLMGDVGGSVAGVAHQGTPSHIKGRKPQVTHDNDHNKGEGRGSQQETSSQEGSHHHPLALWVLPISETIAVIVQSVPAILHARGVAAEGHGGVGTIKRLHQDAQPHAARRDHHDACKQTVKKTTWKMTANGAPPPPPPPRPTK